MHWSSWHNWDGHVVWFAAHNSTFFGLAVIVIVCVFIAVKKYTGLNISNKNQFI